MILRNKAALAISKSSQFPASALRWGIILGTAAIVAMLQSTVIAQTNPNIDNGVKPFGSYDATSIDHIDLASGGLSLHIPLVSFPQRGSFPAASYSIGFAGKQLTILDHCVIKGGEPTCSPRWTPFTIDVAGTPAVGVYLIGDNGVSGVYAKHVGTIGLGNPNSIDIFQYMAVDSDRSIHRLYGSPFSSDLLAEDGSGYLCRACNLTNDWIGGYTAKSRTGITQTSPLGYLAPSNGFVSNIGSLSGEDPHGNLENTTDTMGRTLDTVANSDSSGCQGPLPFANSQVISVPGVYGNNTLIKYCNANLTLLTAFYDGSYFTSTGEGPDTVAEGGPTTINVVQAVLLWDGTGSISSPVWSTSPVWIFQYNNGQNGTGIVNYGDLTQITLPTGGTIQYVWGTIGGLCSEGGTPNMSRGVVSRTEIANDGSPPVVTTYNRSEDPSLTITSNDGINDTVHTFKGIGGTCSLYETQTKYYSGTASAGTLLKTIGTDYTYANVPGMYQFFYNSSPIQVMGVLPSRTTTTLPNGLVSKVEKDYQTATAYYNVANFSGQYQMTTGSVIQQREYDWGSGTPGNLIRCTATTYQDQVNSAYFTANLLDLPASVSVYSGACNSGTLMSQTTYGYDESPVVSSGVATQRDHSITSPGIRGNRTSTHVWVNTTGSTINTSATYYDTGVPYQTVDAKSNTTTYSYSSAYAGAYLTQTQQPTTNSVSHIVQGGYDFNTGLLTSFTDQNNKVFNYAYDDLLRISTAGFPDQGSVSLRYPSLTSVQEITAINTLTNKTVETDFDGLGRLSQTKLLSDPAGTVYTTTTYNAQGQKHQVSTPYRSTSDPTYGLTTFASYDGLGRLLSQIDSDGASNQGWTYNSNAVIFKDEKGNQWQRTTDALGRLTQVLEPNGSSTTPSLETDYTYDGLNNLTCVEQHGGVSGTGCSSSPSNDATSPWHVRRFTYDSLSRLLTAKNPETGTITYSYPAAGAMCAGDPTAVCSKTDARGVVTGFSYDALNRLYAKTYTNAPAGTMESCYQYDTAVNGVGRLAVEWTQAGSCTSPPSTPPAINQSLRTYGAYDAMGRALTELQCAAGFCTTTSVPSQPTANCSALSGATGLQYCYDLAGNLLAYSNGLTTAAAGAYPQQAILFAQTFDAAARLNSVTSSWSDATHPSPLFSATGTTAYTPFSALQNWLLGAHLSVTRSYNSPRLWVTSQTAGQQ